MFATSGCHFLAFSIFDVRIHFLSCCFLSPNLKQGRQMICREYMSAMSNLSTLLIRILGSFEFFHDPMKFNCTWHYTRKLTGLIFVSFTLSLCRHIESLAGCVFRGHLAVVKVVMWTPHQKWWFRIIISVNTEQSCLLTHFDACNLVGISV